MKKYISSFLYSLFLILPRIITLRLRFRCILISRYFSSLYFAFFGNKFLGCFIVRTLFFYVHLLFWFLFHADRTHHSGEEAILLLHFLLLFSDLLLLANDRVFLLLLYTKDIFNSPLLALLSELHLFVLYFRVLLYNWFYS
jgi:hypothetical protein